MTSLDINVNVAVVLVNWNRWSDTLRCLASLRAQMRPTTDIIVVDNASSNDSVERIRSAFPDIAVLVNPMNMGFSGGNNVGIRYALARGANYVWLLNNDTVVEPPSLTQMLDVICQDATIGIVGSVLYEMSQPRKVQAVGGGFVDFLLGIPRLNRSFDRLEKLDYIMGASMLISRAVFEKVGLLDEGFFWSWEDVDFCQRARKAGYRLAVAADTRILHEESSSLGKGNPVLERYFNQSAVRFFQKHSSFPLLPITLGVGGRATKRVLRRDWKAMRATLAGAIRETRRRS